VLVPVVVLVLTTLRDSLRVRVCRLVQVSLPMMVLAFAPMVVESVAAVQKQRVVEARTLTQRYSTY
jgi:hypothetical protein